MYPTTNLQPGMTGDAVLQLQKYLLSQGLLTQAQIDSGPGIYGPKTTAAVAALQQKLGVPNSTGVGYWGPRTIQAVSGSVTPPVTPPSPQTVQFDPNTGSKLASGQTVQFEGQTYTQGQPLPLASTVTQAAQAGWMTALGVPQYGGAPTMTGSEIAAKLGVNLQQLASANPELSAAILAGNQRIDLSWVRDYRGGLNVPSAQTAQTDPVNALIKNSTATDDQKTIAQNLYDIVTTNSTALAERMRAALAAGTEFSDPYFKAQAAIVSDELQRTLSGNEGDLQYKEQTLSRTLNDLQNNINASREYMDLSQTQELDQLAKKYKVDLETTQQNLASVGKSSSSVRSEAEGLLKEQNEGLISSSKRKFGYEMGNLERQLSTSQTNMAAQIAQLRDENRQKRIAALRLTEEKIGTEAMRGLGYNDVLGNVGGSIAQNARKDAYGFANAFVNSDTPFIF